MTHMSKAEKSDKGLPVVLLHGFPFEGNIWREQKRALGDSVKLYTPDMAGFGSAPPLSGDNEPNMDAYADAVAAWAKENDLSEFVLGGHSMGGYVAFAFARKYPEMLRGLMLICTRAGADSEAGREGRYKLAGEVEARGSEAAAGAMLPKLFAPDSSERNADAIEETRATMLRQSPEAITSALKAMAGRPDSTSGLNDITVPTLVITGESDALIPAPEADVLLANIDNSRHVVIEDAGHMPMLENAPDFNKAVSDFLAELTADNR